MDERYQGAAKEVCVLWPLFQTRPPGRGKTESMQGQSLSGKTEEGQSTEVAGIQSRLFRGKIRLPKAVAEGTSGLSAPMAGKKA